MKERFIDKNFRPESMHWVTAIVDVCNAYAARGFKLSLRQVYYQLVAHHGLPNREQSYKNIGSLLSDARLAGLVDWDLIEDRNRETIRNPHWESESEFMRSVARQFRIDLWGGQPFHVEVMVEKAALEGVLEPVCRELDVPFTSNRGYSSSSAMYECGKRIEDALSDEQKIVMVYLGDHDPSGIDMTRDVYERLGLFGGVLEWDAGELYLAEDRLDEHDGNETFGCERFRIRRIALTMGQIEEYAPPPNPAKITDSRATGYIRRFGSESWELDALDPDVLASLVRNEVAAYRDDDLFNARAAEMGAGREKFLAISAKLDAGEL